MSLLVNFKFIFTHMLLLESVKIWLMLDRRHMVALLKFQRSWLSTVIGIIMGHYMIGTYARCIESNLSSHTSHPSCISSYVSITTCAICFKHCFTLSWAIKLQFVLWMVHGSSDGFVLITGNLTRPTMLKLILFYN